jgi:hypothetical protein
MVVKVLMLVKVPCFLHSSALQGTLQILFFALQKEASGARNYDKIAISSLSFEENQSGPVNTYGICMGTDLLDVAERLPGHRKRDRAAFSRVVYGFATRDAKWTPNRISRQEFS